MRKTMVKTIDTLRLEKECVKRFEYCDRRCSVCDIAISTEDKLKALNTAIALLDAQRNINELKGE